MPSWFKNLNNMANIENTGNSKAVKGRTGKATPKVDLTAMVDLMFLLTAFFMLTTTLVESKAADVSKPIPTGVRAPYPASRTMTVVLAKNAQAAYYMGEVDKALIETCSLAEIENQLAKNKLLVAKANGYKAEKFMIVIIKPTKNCSYKDFIDVIDEIKIAGVTSYAIDDENISDRESNFLIAKGL